MREAGRDGDRRAGRRRHASRRGARVRRRADRRACRPAPTTPFPEMREPTITALAVGLYVTGRIAADEALVPNKLLEVVASTMASARDIALVDAVISTERFVGARALWRTETPRRASIVTFADPQAIGLSAIGGLLRAGRPARRRRPGRAARAPSRAMRRLRARRADRARHGAPKSASRNGEPHAGRPAVPVALEAGVGRARRRARAAPSIPATASPITLRENAFPHAWTSARCMQHRCDATVCSAVPSRSRLTKETRTMAWQEPVSARQGPSCSRPIARCARSANSRSGCTSNSAAGDIPGFVHLYAGEEAAGTGIMMPPRRRRPHRLARTAATATASPRASTSAR